nr:zinc finger, CCHC-type, retrotransposon Gag domain protein [Tanacetum cinerariifolium]
SIRQTSSETSTEFMQRFLRLAGFLGASAGTEEEQAKNFQWGLRRRGGNDNHRSNNNNYYSGSNNRPFKSLCFLNYALMIRQDYDITSSLRRGALQALRLKEKQKKHAADLKKEVEKKQGSKIMSKIFGVVYPQQPFIKYYDGNQERTSLSYSAPSPVVCRSTVSEVIKVGEDNSSRKKIESLSSKKTKEMSKQKPEYVMGAVDGNIKDFAKLLTKSLNGVLDSCGNIRISLFRLTPYEQQSQQLQQQIQQQSQQLQQQIKQNTNLEALNIREQPKHDHKVYGSSSDEDQEGEHVDHANQQRNQFMRLASRNQLSEFDAQQITRFNNGLRYDIQAIVSSQTTWTIYEAVRIALKAEQTIKKHGIGSSMYKTKTDTNQSSSSQSRGVAQVDHSKSTHEFGGKKKTPTTTTSTHARVNLAEGDKAHSKSEDKGLIISHNAVFKDDDDDHSEAFVGLVLRLVLRKVKTVNDTTSSKQGARLTKMCSTLSLMGVIDYFLSFLKYKQQ